MENVAYLSIIVPCYNGEKTIEDTIQSVVQQKRSDVELLIVNDGSTDHTEEICQKYEEAQLIRYFRTANMGAGHARNYGMSKARGKWLAFLDADDLYVEGSLDQVLPALRKYEEQGIEVVYTATTKGDMELNNAVVRQAEEIEKISHIPIYEFVSCIYRKDFMVRKNIRFFEYKEQDVESAFRYLVFSHSPRAITDNQLMYYFQRINPNSNTHTWKEDVLHRVKSRIFLELLENNVKKDEDTWLLRVVLKEVSKFYLFCAKHGCPGASSMQWVEDTYQRAVRLGKTIPQNRETIRYSISARVWRFVALKLRG